MKRTYQPSKLVRARRHGFHAWLPPVAAKFWPPVANMVALNFLLNKK